MGELGLGKLAEDLELTDADRLRKEVAAQPIGALALGVVRVVPAQPVVVGILAFDREDAAVGQFLLQQEIDGGRGVAGLNLRRAADGEQVLVAVVGAVQVVAFFRVPEIDLDASGPNDFGTAVADSPSNAPAETFTFLAKSPQ